MFPEDLKYYKEHEWVRVDGDVAVIGISDYAQEALGDIVYLELPVSGTAVAAGETFGEVESVKSVSQLFSPVSGEIVETNDDRKLHAFFADIFNYRIKVDLNARIFRNRGNMDVAVFTNLKIAATPLRHAVDALRFFDAPI